MRFDPFALLRRERFLGGFNIPSPGPFKGRTSVPRAWGELEVEPGALRLGPRVDALALLVPETRLAVDDVLVVCPTLADLLGTTAGVAIVRDDAVPLYFWTRTPEPVLAALAAQGFRVSCRPVEVRAA